MKCIPILFKPEMVKAIIDGKKTQTRRIIKPQPESTKGRYKLPMDFVEFTDKLNSDGKRGFEILCTNGSMKGYISPKPKINDGDILYVRENWAFTDEMNIVYQADENILYKNHAIKKWKPSIHLPKKHSRLFLNVVSVEGERLQDISEEDALAEGIDSTSVWTPSGDDYTGLYASEHFMDLWDSINKGLGFGWDTNPWVWVVKFEKTDKPDGWPV